MQVTTCSRKVKMNENAFTSVREDTCQAKNILSIKEKETKERGTHRMGSLSKLEHYLNDKLSCKCHANDVVEDFIKHYCTLNANKYGKLAGLYSNYKHKEIQGMIKSKRHISWNCY